MLQDGYNELLEAVEEHKASSATAASALASGPSSADGESASREGDDGDDGGDDDDETWTAAEFALMPNVLGGIKVACNAITKTADLLGTMGGIASNPDAVDAMPDIADAMCAISDDFVLACYGSVDLVELNQNAVLLRTRFVVTCVCVCVCMCVCVFVCVFVCTHLNNLYAYLSCVYT